jgi:hypothetical protein
MSLIERARRKVADVVLPWAATNATVWPSTHAQHRHLLAEVTRLHQQLEGAANPPGAVEALEIIAGANENTMRQWEGEAKRLRHQLEGTVDERERLREVLRAVLMEPDPIKRNQLAAPVLTNPGGQVAR